MELRDKFDELVKKSVEVLVDDQKREWPPGCLGLWFQPERPISKTLDK